MRTNKHDLFSIKRQEQDSSVKMDAVFFIDDFFESEEKEEFDTEISEDLLFLSLILRTRIKDGYHVLKIDKFVEEIEPRMNEIEF